MRKFFGPGLDKAPLMKIQVVMVVRILADYRNFLRLC